MACLCVCLRVCDLCESVYLRVYVCVCACMCVRVREVCAVSRTVLVCVV